MKVKQISIFIENKKGRLSEVTEILYKNNINIRALSIADTSDFGILRLIVNKPDEAVEKLKANKFTVSGTDVFAIEVEDKPGGLNQIMKILSKEEINIEYMYAFVEKKNDNAVVIIRVENMDKASEILKKNNIKILDSAEVYNL